MDLDLRDLELLDALADAQTLTAAAKSLYVSQPALSQRLTKMEDKLGVRLFDREGRRLVVNPAGRRMLVASRLVLAELRSAERDVRDIRDGANGRVRFTSQCSTTFQWLPPVLKRFREQQPNIEIRIETVPGDDPIGALVDDRVDVALVTKLDRQMDRVLLTPLFDDEMVAVVAGPHPWAARRYVTARDFDDAHLILYDVYDQTRIPSTPLPVPHGARPARITTMPVITDLLIEMVAGGEGVTVLPNWVAAPYTTSHDVEIVHLGAKPLIRTWYCATRPGPRLPHIDAFVQELTRELEAPTRRDWQAVGRLQRIERAATR
jgi:LysR family transcriptional regulator for metE and metH